MNAKKFYNGSIIISLLLFFPAANASLTTEEAKDFIAEAETYINQSGGQCKIFAQKVAKDSLGVVLPSNAASQYEWRQSSAVNLKSQWRASYANGFKNTNLGAGKKVTYTFRAPNDDPQVVVLYASPTVKLDVFQSSTKKLLSINGTAAGTISPIFTGKGNYTISLLNQSANTQTITVSMISKSRFESDYATALQGDVQQMYFAPNSTGSSTPHTAIVKRNGNGAWVHSNWCQGNCELVSITKLSLDKMIQWTARKPDFGFSVYGIE